MACALGYFPRGRERPQSGLINPQYVLRGGFDFAPMRKAQWESFKSPDTKPASGRLARFLRMGRGHSSSTWLTEELLCPPAHLRSSPPRVWDVGTRPPLCQPCRRCQQALFAPYHTPAAGSVSVAHASQLLSLFSQIQPF